MMSHTSKLCMTLFIQKSVNKRYKYLFSLYQITFPNWFEHVILREEYDFLCKTLSMQSGSTI